MTTIEIRSEPRYARERLAAGVDQPRLGGAAGLEPDGDRSVGRRLAREIDRRAQLMMRVEEVDGDFGVGVEPMDLEPAALHAAVDRRARQFTKDGRGREEHAADHPGILDRLTVRPDDPAVHGHARAEHDVDVQGSRQSALGSQAMKAWA